MLTTGDESRPGMSGSPIFSKDNWRFQGIHREANQGKMAAGFIPRRCLLTAFQKSATHAIVAPKLVTVHAYQRATVDQFFRPASAAAPPMPVHGATNNPSLAFGHIFRGVSPVNEIIGFKTALRELDSAHQSTNHSCVVQVTGPSGSGKTTLIRNWLFRRLSASLDSPTEGVYTWSFDQRRATWPMFCADFYKLAYGRSIPDDDEIITAIGSVVVKRPILLILDGIDRLPPNGAESKQLQFFIGAIQRPGEGLCILSGEQALDSVSTIQPELTLDEAHHFLRVHAKTTFSPPKIERAGRLPLALLVLAGISSFPDVDTYFPDGYDSSVPWWNWAFSRSWPRLSLDEQVALKILAHADGPVEERMLHDQWQRVWCGLGESCISIEPFLKAIRCWGNTPITTDVWELPRELGFLIKGLGSKDINRFILRALTDEGS